MKRLVLSAAMLFVAAMPGIAQAEGPPPSSILGGWEVTGHRDLTDGAATTYHYERDPAGAEGTADCELQWHRGPAAEVGAELEARGLVASGTLPTAVEHQLAIERNDWAHAIVDGTAQVWVAPSNGGQFFEAVGVWEEDGYTYALSAQVDRLYMLERLLERVEILDGNRKPAASSARKGKHRRHAHHRHHHRKHQKGSVGQTASAS